MRKYIILAFICLMHPIATIKGFVNGIKIASRLNKNPLDVEARLEQMRYKSNTHDFMSRL